MPVLGMDQLDAEIAVDEGLTYSKPGVGRYR